MHQGSHENCRGQAKAAQFLHPEAISLSQFYELITAPNYSLLPSFLVSPCDFCYYIQQNTPTQYPPSVKNSRGYDWFCVASLTQPQPLLLRGSECVTQDYTVHCESESGRLRFGMYGGVKEWDVLFILSLIFSFLFYSYQKKTERTRANFWNLIWKNEETFIINFTSSITVSADLSVFSIALKPLDGLWKCCLFAQ